MSRIDIQRYRDSFDIVARYVSAPANLTDKIPIQTGGETKIFLKWRPCN
ncbi:MULTISPECIES: hypothetical protein [Burkholderia]|nr:hypothetical protein [Burkholderia cepacia]MCA8056133.1 hypothetical protein [Burkholderia cepacia]MCA8132622.1 hypothetical protein [Burkholderia cepacia]MCA8158771.1 hypothetical protein [Burkholderia cepacia]MCA8464523.1 hypothetical protein [Burkholderia cepacia]MDN7632467.1 hypothetical protein [Burkholderia cepacia]